MTIQNDLPVQVTPTPDGGALVTPAPAVDEDAALLELLNVRIAALDLGRWNGDMEITSVNWLWIRPATWEYPARPELELRQAVIGDAEWETPDGEAANALMMAGNALETAGWEHYGDDSNKDYDLAWYRAPIDWLFPGRVACPADGCRWGTEVSIAGGLTPQQVLGRLESIRMEMYRIQRDDLVGDAYHAASQAKSALYDCIAAVKANPLQR